MKFHENILNGFQVIQRTRTRHSDLNFKGNNSTNELIRVMVLVVCRSSVDALYFYEVSWKYLERFSSYRADTIFWQTDRRTDGRTDNIPLFYRRWKNMPKLSPFASWPGTVNNPQWLELPMSRTNFYGPKDDQAIEVRLFKKIPCLRTDYPILFNRSRPVLRQYVL